MQNSVQISSATCTEIKTPQYLGEKDKVYINQFP